MWIRIDNVGHNFQSSIEYLTWWQELYWITLFLCSMTFPLHCLHESPWHIVSRILTNFNPFVFIHLFKTLLVPHNPSSGQVQWQLDHIWDIYKACRCQKCSHWVNVDNTHRGWYMDERWIILSIIHIQHIYESNTTFWIARFGHFIMDGQRNDLSCGGVALSKALTFYLCESYGWQVTINIHPCPSIHPHPSMVQGYKGTKVGKRACTQPHLQSPNAHNLSYVAKIVINRRDAANLLNYKLWPLVSWRMPS